MGTTIGIYEPFKPYVKKQLEARRKVLSEGRENPLISNPFYAYTVEKRCVITMVSGVDLKESANNDLLEENEKGKTGSALAKRYILRGGVPNFIENSFANQRGGFNNTGDENTQSAYGDPSIRSNTKDGYGIVPMPGIIDAIIATKSSEGAVREATVNFTAHNRRQLAILETLYMRPGMNILLEWQWTPYITTDENGNISVEETEASSIREFFNPNSNLNIINDNISRNKEIYEGNYDGFVGYCKNFSITAREDGGFDCTTEIVAHGDLIEGLKSGKEVITVGKISGTDIDKVEVLDKFLKYLNGINQTHKMYDRPPNIIDPNIGSKSQRKTTLESYKSMLDKGMISEALYEDIKTAQEKYRKEGARKIVSFNVGTENQPYYILFNELKSYGRNQNYIEAYKEIEDLYLEINKFNDTPDKFNSPTTLDEITGRGYQSFLGGTILKQVVKEKIYNYTPKGSGPDPGRQGVYADKGFSNNTFIRWDLVCQILNHKIIDSYKNKSNALGDPVFELSYVNNGSPTYSKETEPQLLPTSNDFKGYFYIPYSAPKTTKSDPISKMKPVTKETLTKYKIEGEEVKIKGTIDLNSPFIENEEQGEDQFHPILGNSYDYNVCLLPHMDFLQRLNYVDPNVTDTNEQQIQRDINFSFLSSFYPFDFEKHQINSIGLIYINLDYLINEYVKMRFESTQSEYEATTYPRFNPDFNMFDFIKQVWDGVNAACGGYYNFDLTTEHERPNVVKVVDKTVSGKLSSDQINDYFKFDPQGLNSITRDFIYESQITKDFANAVSIAAQAPNEEQSLDAKSFKAFNKNVKNRFSDSLSEDQKAIQAATLKSKLQKDVNLYRGIVYGLYKYLEGISLSDVTPYFTNNPENLKERRNRLTPSQAVSYAQELEELRISIEDRFPLDHPDAGYFRENTSSGRNIIVPLGFSIKMDGIGGIIPYQAFRIDKDKLPLGYESNDIGFVIFTESQQIDASGDWTITFTGQYCNLPNSENFNNDGYNEYDEINRIPQEENELDLEDRKFEGLSSPANIAPDSWTNPVNHPIRITSPWGREREGTKRHRGVDIGPVESGRDGDPILAAAAGEVFQIIDDNVCGKGVFIQHPLSISIAAASDNNNSVRTRYCHLSEVHVSEGDSVAKGEVIGAMGNTGRSFGTHLHYEVYDGGQKNLKEITSAWEGGWSTLSNGAVIDTTGTTDPALYLYDVNQ